MSPPVRKKKKKLAGIEIFTRKKKNDQIYITLTQNLIEGCYYYSWSL